MSTKKAPADKAKKPQAKKVNTPASIAAASPSPDDQAQAPDPATEDDTDVQAPVEVQAEGATPETGNAGNGADLLSPDLSTTDLAKELSKAAKILSKAGANAKKLVLEEAIKKRAKQIFLTHTNSTIYFTQDCSAFLEPQYARMHAESLKDKEVTTIERKEIL